MRLGLCMSAFARRRVHFRCARWRPRCLHIISGYFQTLLPSTCTRSSAPHLEMSLRQREPHTRRIPLVFPSLRPRIGESNLLLAEMSATIKVSPGRRGNAFERLCVLVGGGLGEHTGMSYVPSWHERDSSECQ